MKKILIAAALVASVAMPSTSFAAGAPAAAAASPKPICYLLPLLPDCLSAWKTDSDAFWHKVSTKPKAAPKVAAIAPVAPKMPSCTKAAAGAGHLYDCKM
jgi:hypothetical protein